MLVISFTSGWPVPALPDDAFFRVAPERVPVFIGLFSAQRAESRDFCITSSASYVRTSGVSRPYVLQSSRTQAAPISIPSASPLARNRTDAAASG